MLTTLFFDKAIAFRLYPKKEKILSLVLVQHRGCGGLFTLQLQPARVRPLTIVIERPHARLQYNQIEVSNNA